MLWVCFWNFRVIILLNLAFSTEKTVGCSRCWKDSLTYEHAHVDYHIKMWNKYICINFFLSVKTEQKLLTRKGGKRNSVSHVIPEETQPIRQRERQQKNTYQPNKTTLRMHKKMLTKESSPNPKNHPKKKTNL